MTELMQPGPLARRVLLRRALGAGAMLVAARAARAEDAAEIKIDNFVFSPTPLTVKVGTTVTWKNQDDIPHSIVCAALNMRSKPMDTDGQFSFRFDRAGRFAYICGLHPHMHGMVVVQG